MSESTHQQSTLHSTETEELSDVTSKKKTRTIYNSGDPRFSVMEWHNNTINVISMIDMEKLDNYEIDQSVKCRLGTVKTGYKSYRGIIKFIGNF